MATTWVKSAGTLVWPEAFQPQPTVWPPLWAEKVNDQQLNASATRQAEFREAINDLFMASSWEVWFLPSVKMATHRARQVNLIFLTTGLRTLPIFTEKIPVVISRDCVKNQTRDSNRILIQHMDFDISHILDAWDYKPGQVVVRKLKGRDGVQKIQLRVDLGLLQMNVEGRPDGRQPFGHPSLFDYHQHRLCRHRAAHGGSTEGFALKPEDCAKLQIEALQYHHRYICLLQLGDYAGVERDAQRNLDVFRFVSQHAESEELAWSLLQFQPQLMMILTRARAMQAMDANDYAGAIELVEQALEEIRAFYRERSKLDLLEQSGEMHSLETWLEEIRADRPLSVREKLERALSDAIQREDYEKAAQMRDALRDLKPE
jgi:tetratricopeptide (TPR) repeat protein